MSLRPDLSVKARLLWTVVVLVSSILVFQLLYFPAQQSRAMSDALGAKAQSVAQLTAHTVAPGLEFDDTAMVGEVFKGALADPELLYIALYKADGSRAVASGSVAAPDRASPGERVLELRDGTMHVGVPVVTRSGGTGQLLAGFSTANIVQREAENWLVTLGLNGVIFLGGLLAAFVIANNIGNPLQEMAEISKHVAAGRLDFEPPARSTNDEIGQMAASFRQMLATLRRLEEYVLLVSKGDLTHDVQVQGDLAAALNRMVANQRGLVTQIADTSSDIRQSATQILATSLQLEQTASEQAAVVEQTLRTMESLLGSANQISDVSQKVLGHAEHTHANSKQIAERITELAGHTQRIAGFLEIIKDIANKTDLLALNAALEGTRAGEAGRGFSLVASQMQRLTVNVMDAVEDIKTLTSDIREATSASVLATEDATKRALSTEQSARQINLIIQQQQSGTEQVSESMGEISEAIRQSVAASTQSARAATELSELSQRLELHVTRFQLRAPGASD